MKGELFMQNDEVRIVNYKQAKMYIKYGLQPIRLEYDARSEKIVFIFDRKASQPYFDMWRRYELN